MPLTFEEVEDWTRRTGTLESLQDELSQRTTTLAGLQDQLSDIRRLDGWKGSAAHAARQSFDPVDDDIAKAAAAVGAVRAQVGETIPTSLNCAARSTKPNSSPPIRGTPSSSTAISSTCGTWTPRPTPARPNYSVMNRREGA